MQENLGTVVLDGGERVAAAVISAPDAEWADRLLKFLEHKGEPWNWGNVEVLTKPTGIHAYFYILHRRGIPLANIMTCEVNGVGRLAHVFTRPEDRGKGACDQLMGLQMEHFRSRGGRALFLGTRFGRTAYRIYARHEFRGIEDQSGCMEYYAATREEFEASWFARTATQVEPYTLAYWPILAPLFTGGSQGQVRCARLGVIGRHPADLLKPLYDERLPVEGRTPSAFVLRSRQSNGPVGFATSGVHPIWPGLCVVDVFCHSDFWDRAGDLLASLPLPPAGHCIAYADINWTAKDQALRQAGFQQTAVLPRHVRQTAAKTSFIDVAVYEKELRQ